MILRYSTLSLVCLLFASGVARPEDANELKNLEGTWSFVKPSGGGAQKKNRGSVQVVFKGDTITFLADDEKRTVRGTYTVDPSQRPKTMDITLDRGGAKAVTQAIYELDGDSLRLCHFLGEMAGTERPTEFAADKQTVLGVLKREKK